MQKPIPATYQLPGEGFIRLSVVLTVIPVGKTTWWNGVKAGRFPKPLKLGRCTVWEVEKIRALIEAIKMEETDELS